MVFHCFILALLLGDCIPLKAIPFWSHIKGYTKVAELSMKVKFDQDLAKIIKIKDNRSIFKKSLLLNFIFDLYPDLHHQESQSLRSLGSLDLSDLIHYL